MSKISGRINLAQLTGAIRTMKGKDGDVDCFVLPISTNNLYRGAKGLYLDIIAFEVDPAKRNTDSKDTHLVKQSLSKDARALLSDEEQRAMPILGNLSVWGDYEPDVKADLEAKPEITDLPF